MRQEDLSLLLSRASTIAGPRVSTEQCIAALQRVAAEEGKVTSATYAKVATAKGLPSPTTISHRFGSWAVALQAAGFDSPVRRAYVNRTSEEEMLAAVRRCCEETGDHLPTLEVYRAWRAEHEPTAPGDAGIRRRMRGWRTVLRMLNDDEGGLA